MSMSITAILRGHTELQEANQQIIAAVQPSGRLGRAVVYVTTQAQRYAIYNTPWDTTVLRKSHRMEISGGGKRGRVYIDPATVNPMRGNRRPSVYGAELHTHGLTPGVRGGIRAFYQYTVEHDGPGILRRGVRLIEQGLPK